MPHFVQYVTLWSLQPSRAIAFITRSAWFFCASMT